MSSDDSTGGYADDTDLRDSDPNAGGPDGLAGGMGVSSERTGPTGPGQYSTNGVRDVSETDRHDPADPVDDADVPPEQAAGGHEDNPDGLEPKAGYPSEDPRSD